LENVLVHEDFCLVIDMGMCLRVPYIYPRRPDERADATMGTMRRLMLPQGTCGKHNYMSPEIYQNTDNFDGFAIDLWASGVILYIMLTGFPPYDHASLADQRFEIIANGQLMEQLASWEIIITREAGDLLQKMLNHHPRDRLTLAQVMAHPWVLNDEVQLPAPNRAVFH